MWVLCLLLMVNCTLRSWGFGVIQILSFVWWAGLSGVVLWWFGVCEWIVDLNVGV